MGWWETLIDQKKWEGNRKIKRREEEQKRVEIIERIKRGNEKRKC